MHRRLKSFRDWLTNASRREKKKELLLWRPFNWFRSRKKRRNTSTQCGAGRKERRRIVGGGEEHTRRVGGSRLARSFSLCWQRRSFSFSFLFFNASVNNGAGHQDTKLQPPNKSFFPQPTDRPGGKDYCRFVAQLFGGDQSRCYAKMRGGSLQILHRHLLCLFLSFN